MARLSVEVSQIIRMVPTADIPHLHGLPLQPQGEHPHMVAFECDRRKVHDVALNVLKDGAITQKACDYPTHWA